MTNTSNLFDEIKTFLGTPSHLDFLQAVLSSTEFHVAPDLYDIEIDYTISRIESAQISFDEIRQLIENNDENLKTFCSSYLKAQKQMDLGEEYNPEEFDEEDLEETNEQYVGHSKTFILQYAVFYIVLSQKPDEFAGYLKKIRVPHAAKQAKLFKNFYLSLNLHRS